VVSYDVFKAPDLPQAYRKWVISLACLLLSLLIYSLVKGVLVTIELSPQCNGVTVFPSNTWGHFLNLLQIHWADRHLKPERQNFHLDQFVFNVEFTSI